MNMVTNLLIVDDEPNMLLVLEEAVAPLGFQVKTAGTYALALDSIKSSSPDVVLCDLRLDTGSGLELFDLSRSLPKPPQFVFLSGQGTIESAVQALKSGAFDFLTKPVTDQHLLTVVKAAADRAHGSTQGAAAAGAISLRNEVEDHERALIVAALERNGWVQAKAARELGLERSHLHYKIRKYNLSKPQTAV
ncbi:MAG: response regulator [Proteobacteria bacterium]|nr:response regulator [Pseudomonadota bacterium]